MADDQVTPSTHDDDTPTTSPTPPKGVPTIPPRPGGAPPQMDYSEAIERDKAPEPSTWQRIGRAAGRVFGWLVALALGLLIALALLVFNLPPFDQLPNPLRDNADSITVLEEDLAAAQATIEGLMAEQEAMAESMEATAEARFEEAGDQISTLEAANAAQDDMLNQMGDTDAEQESMIGAVEDDLDGLAATLGELEDELPGTEEYAEYNRQLLLMRAWLEVSDALDRLEENNVGLAVDSIEGALATLAQAREFTPEDDLDRLEQVIERLEMVISGVDDNPFAAVRDLEVAWRTLGDLVVPPGVEVVPVTPAPTPTEEATPTGDLTPTPDPNEITATPEG